jgi:hypothetical protein
MKSFQTQIYNQVSPIGFDFQVYLVQLQFSRLSWLEGCFGIAHRQKRILSEGEAKTREEQGFRGSQKYQVWYPQGFKNQVGVTSSIIDQDLSFDDSYASRIFFLMLESNINPKADPYNPVELGISIDQKCSMILHCNLDALEIPTSEQIKTDILYIFNSIYKIKGLEICESIEEVWKEFDITVGINGVTRYPNYCLRVDFILTYEAFPVNGGVGYDPATNISTRFILNWDYCSIQVDIVSIPNPSTTQTLINGEVIPIEYSANGDGTVTIPYLNSVLGIKVLSRFMLNGSYYQGNFFLNGVINTLMFGALGVGDKLNFDISVPIWSS